MGNGEWGMGKQIFIAPLPTPHSLLPTPHSPTPPLPHSPTPHSPTPYSPLPADG
ncbi:MAG: hypothetical protein DSM106950_04280 [Stigonema ocellatum SAG 48.90 = DSM 106950]|nr:hypothetical protein [Stigonema ocellatum SAG 48.90 = DSM 106950]